MENELSKKCNALTEYINTHLVSMGYKDILIDKIIVIDGTNQAHTGNKEQRNIKLEITADFLENFKEKSPGIYDFTDDSSKYKALRMIGHEIGHVLFDKGISPIFQKAICQINGDAKLNTFLEQRILQAAQELRADIVGANLFQIPDKYLIEIFKDNKYSMSDCFAYGYPPNDTRALISMCFDEINFRTSVKIIEEIIAREGLGDKINVLNLAEKFTTKTMEFHNGKVNEINKSKLTLDDVIEMSKTIPVPEQILQKKNREEQEK